LENFLSDFPGCLLIVSHDRYFMDRLVDHLFVFEGEGEIRDFPGNYSQYRIWLKEKEEAGNQKPEAISQKSEIKTETNKPVTVEKRKLSYKEKREFEQLQQEISSLEKEKQTITEQLNSGSLPFEQLQQLALRISEITGLLDEKEMRWLELSEFE
jgi:ATP-binding cassette subfamily F protein uup